MSLEYARRDNLCHVRFVVLPQQSQMFKPVFKNFLRGGEAQELSVPDFNVGRADSGGNTSVEQTVGGNKSTLVLIPN